jgi:hypothetical protein
VSSKDSRGEDRGPKFALYQNRLQCREYLIYDEDLKELLLYRLTPDGYALVAPDPDGSVFSEETGLRFACEPRILVRVFDGEGRPVPNPDEGAEQLEMMARIRERLESEAQDHRLRADALADEVASLRAELERLRKAGP